mmetsp:Transcript_34061/g.113686  ORF Transcript_34061/g.113686 Transcript_34061/m.113686 type:complete len:234 (+) Transcript_34061:908-1609(+)
MLAVAPRAARHLRLHGERVQLACQTAAVGPPAEVGQVPPVAAQVRERDRAEHTRRRRARRAVLSGDGFAPCPRRGGESLLEMRLLARKGRAERLRVLRRRHYHDLESARADNGPHATGGELEEAAALGAEEAVWHARATERLEQAHATHGVVLALEEDQAGLAGHPSRRVDPHAGSEVQAKRLGVAAPLPAAPVHEAQPSRLAVLVVPGQRLVERCDVQEVAGPHDVLAADEG